MYKLLITIRIKPDQNTMYLNKTYYDFLKSYFDVEVAFPKSIEQYQEMVKRNDILVVSGGGDLPARYYNEEDDPTNTFENDEIDQMDFDLVKLFRKANKPVFGICRGIQVINVMYGGTLFQNISNHQGPEIFHYNNVLSDSILAKHVDEKIYVNSYHHQNIKDLADGFKVSCISEDGYIEGIEGDGIFAVQWHPERIVENQKKIINYMMTLIQSA